MLSGRGRLSCKRYLTEVTLWADVLSSAKAKTWPLRETEPSQGRLIVFALEEEMTDFTAPPAHQFLNQSSMKPFLVDLRTKAWRTAGARYNASRRLRRREWVSTSSLALLSALSVGVAFSQKVYAKSGTPLDDYLSVVAMGLGVLLLVISLLEWGAGYGVRAEALFKNAELLTAFQFKVAQTLEAMNAKVTVSLHDVDLLRQEYEAAKDRCTTNHQPLDDALFRAQKRFDPAFRGPDKAQMGLLDALYTQVAWLVAELWFFGLIWLLVFGAIGYAFYLGSIGSPVVPTT